MFSDISAFFFEQVVPAFSEYVEARQGAVLGRSRDTIRVQAAASALYHIRERLPKSHSMTRERVEALCPDYGLLGDIANLSKHHFLTGKTPHGAPLISKYSDLCEALYITLYQDSDGDYRLEEKHIIANLVDGTSRNVLSVLVKVINFWHDYLYKIGAIPCRHYYEGVIPSEPRSREWVNNAPKIALELVRGLRYQPPIICFNRYNYETSRIEPISLTEVAKVSMSVHSTSPPTIKLEMTHPLSTSTLTDFVPLTTEDVDAINLIEPNERGRYIKSLVPIGIAIAKLTAKMNEQVERGRSLLSIKLSMKVIDIEGVLPS